MEAGPLWGHPEDRSLSSPGDALRLTICLDTGTLAENTLGAVGEALLHFIAKIKFETSIL